MNNENGFIVLHRKIVNWKFYQSDSGFRLWLHILLRANWKDGYFLGQKIPRGSLATSIRQLADETGLSESTVKRWLKRFENERQIVTQVNNRFRVIKVVNYNAFQDIPRDGVNNQMTDQVNNQVTYQMTDQVTDNRTKKQSNKETNKESVERKYTTSFSPPTLTDIESFVSENSLVVDPKYFFDYYESAGWKSDWKARLRRWDKEDREKKPKQQQSPKVIPMPSYMQKQNEEMLKNFNRQIGAEKEEIAEEEEEEKDDLWFMGY